MKITKGCLKKIIREETEGVLESVSREEKRERNTKRKQKQRNRDDMHFGSEEMRKLSKGIVGEDNYWRDKDGHTSSKKDAKTYSSYFIDGVRKNLKGSTPHKDDSGRGKSRSGQGKYKVDGTAKWEGMVDGIDKEEERVNLSMPELSNVVDDCLLSFLDNCGKQLAEDKVIEEEEDFEWASACASRGYKSFEQLLKAMNNIVKSSKGELIGSGK